jgi:3D (Asp-Asp-Asp) domain-containing protein
VKSWEVGRALIALLIAAAVIQSGLGHLPISTSPEPFRHPPVLVYAEPMLPPLVVRAQRALPALTRLSALSRLRKLPDLHKAFVRAPFGKPLKVSITQYCLQGTTRLDHAVREGIVAADPRIFPLAHHVEVFLGKHHLGRFLVDDTGEKVKGNTLDIWTPSCSEARRFGRQRGTAILVVKPE